MERPWTLRMQRGRNDRMPVHLNVCSDRVEANRGRVAVTRGPLVYCAEEIDNGGPVGRLAIPEPVGAEECIASLLTEDPLSGVVMVSMPGFERVVSPGGERTVMNRR